MDEKGEIIEKEWIKTEEKLPEKDTWVKVKDPLVEGKIGHAVLIDTAWGTTEWLYAGMIHMAIDMIKEWREIEEDKDETDDYIPLDNERKYKE